MKEAFVRRIFLALFFLVLGAPRVLAQQASSKGDTGPDNPSELYKL